MLANLALGSEESKDDNLFHIDELLRWIPQFQHGMDVNLGFRRVDHYEYTPQLTAWDMFRIQLVHGWIVDPNSAEADVIQSLTYNVLVEKIIQAQDAAAELEPLEAESPDITTFDDNTLVERSNKIHQLRHVATQGTLMEHFLESTSHQLTSFGLEQLRRHLANEQLAVFFRNNHFALMTKHEDQLYLLVTDLGYADSRDIVWERLDAIDGNTTLVNADFAVNTRQDEEEAYQLALQLSLQQQDQAMQLQHRTTVELPPLEGTRVELPDVAVNDASPQPIVAAGVPVGDTVSAVRDRPVSSAPSSGNAPPKGESSAALRSDGPSMAAPAANVDPDTWLARQLQDDWNNESSTDEAASMQLARQLEAEDTASLQLAQRLQAEENARSRPAAGSAAQAASRPAGRAQAQAGCLIS